MADADDVEISKDTTMTTTTITIKDVKKCQTSFEERFTKAKLAHYRKTTSGAFLFCRILDAIMFIWGNTRLVVIHLFY